MQKPNAFLFMRTNYVKWIDTSITFEIEDDDDALEVAADLALLEGSELIYLSRC